MPPSAKHSSEWLVLHPSSIDEAPQCHPEANLAQVGCAQIPVRRSKVRLSPNRKLSSFHGAIGTAKLASLQYLGSGVSQDAGAFVVTGWRPARRAWPRRLTSELLQCSGRFASRAGG